MSRSLAMLTAVLCYAAFFASFVYLVGFVAGIDLLPTHVDKGLAAPLLTAAIIDLALIALFGIQHSVMARPSFKAGWTRVVSPAIERSVYCLAAALCLIVLFAFWHPIEGTVWSVEAPMARMAIWALFLLGWTILFIATWLISHWELFGLAHLAVSNRPGYAPHGRRWPQVLSPELDAACRDRHAADPAALRATPAGRVIAFDMTPLAISASLIRDLVAHRASVRYLLPDPVVDYIGRHHLYG